MMHQPPCRAPHTNQPRRAALAQDECAPQGCAPKKPGGPAVRMHRVVFTFPEFVYVTDYLAFLGEYFFQLQRYDRDPILEAYDLTEYLETVDQSITNVAIDSDTEYENSDSELDQTHLSQLELLIRNQQLDLDFDEGN